MITKQGFYRPNYEEPEQFETFEITLGVIGAIFMFIGLFVVFFA